MFPANDTSVASNIALVAGSAPLDTLAILGTHEPHRGMQCLQLLLAQPEARGEMGADRSRNQNRTCTSIFDSRGRSESHSVYK